jgi:hypothetical protein
MEVRVASHITSHDDSLAKFYFLFSELYALLAYRSNFQKEERFYQDTQ